MAAVTKDRLYLWDTASGAALGDWSVGTENRCVAFAMARGLIAVGDATGTSLGSGHEEGDRPAGQRCSTDCAALSPAADGNLLVSSAGAIRDRISKVGEVAVWDVQTHKKLADLPGPTRGMTGIAVARDGKSAIASSEDGLVRVWDLKSMGRTNLAAFEGHTQAITGLALSSDRTRLLSSSDGAASGSGTSPPASRLQQFVGHAWTGNQGIAFKADDQTAFTMGADRSLRCWNVKDGKLVKRWDVPGLVTELASAPGSKWLALNIGGAKIQLFDMTAGAFTREIPAAVQQIQISPDGAGVYGLAYPKRIRRWGTASGEEAAPVEASLGAFLSVLAVSADGTRIAVGNRQGVYAVFDGAGKEISASPSNFVRSSGPGIRCDRSRPAVLGREGGNRQGRQQRRLPPRPRHGQDRTALARS